ncbi:30S ribosomal subunit protein S3 [Candidatus Zinderia insecticola CARI]|uniref:Small ribosomal subunit protein uS3 n=1 Tax=Zinderia insecticola (strain CARI) TaxID=871271 RepID=E0TJ41_ZINIC|nr:30S ribosomal subunit protein S3 [Candidatus Zinderia insecticola CARI]
MGQKINPICFRLSINKNWKSSWCSNKKNFSKFLKIDILIRSYIKNNLDKYLINDIIIEHYNNKILTKIFTCSQKLFKKNNIEKLESNINKNIFINKKIFLIKIKSSKLNAQYIANSISLKLKKRILFRKIMKKYILKLNNNIKGIKIMLSGRLNGIEIARKEWYSLGKVPLHKLSANIDYGFSEAKTNYGIISSKVWIYKK